MIAAERRVRFQLNTAGRAKSYGIAVKAFALSMADGACKKLPPVTSRRLFLTKDKHDADLDAPRGHIGC
jgi:hypothetical protein